MGWFRFSYRLILLPSFVGLTCYACSTIQNLSSVESDDADLQLGTSSQSSDTVDSASSSASASGIAVEPEIDSATSSFEAYREGINLASTAHQLSQSAISPDDWDLIASRWQRAADQLRQIAPDDENYGIAQQKIAEYMLNAETAEAQIARLQTPIHVPLDHTRPTLHSPSRTTAAIPSEPLQTGIVQIPIVRRLYGTPVVQVTFNGIRSYEMILDTGASRTLITRQMANELGIVPTERMIANTASQAEVSFDIGRMNSIAMGGVILENARVSIGDAVDIGLLGNDFLRDYDVTIRTREGVVELTRAH